MILIVFAILGLVAVVWGIGVYNDLDPAQRPLGAVFLWLVYVQAVVSAFMSYLFQRRAKDKGGQPS